MIREAIRFSSIFIQYNCLEYLNQFALSANMDFARETAIERSKHRRRLRSSRHKNIPFAFPPDAKFRKENYELSFQDIIFYLRSQCTYENKDLIQKVNSIIGEVCQKIKPHTTTSKQEKSHQIIEYILGEDLIQTLLPEIDFDPERIHTKCCNNLGKIRRARESIPMFADFSEPLSSLTIDHKIIRQGICSNGNYLFILTQKKNFAIVFHQQRDDYKKNWRI